jgi:hypothetical protein
MKHNYELQQFPTLTAPHRVVPEVNRVERAANNIGTEKAYMLPLVLSAVGVIQHELCESMKLLDSPFSLLAFSNAESSNTI